MKLAAALQSQIWIEPSGRIVELKGGETHGDWAMRFLQLPTPDPNDESVDIDDLRVDAIEKLLEQGWMRMGTFARGGDPQTYLQTGRPLSRQELATAQNWLHKNPTWQGREISLDTNIFKSIPMPDFLAMNKPEEIRRFARKQGGAQPPNYIYHATFLRNLEQIASEGLQVSGGSQFNGGYDGHSRGRVFFSDWKGVQFWLSKMEQIAHNNSDFNDDEAFGWAPIVIRMDIAAWEGDQPAEDDLGYQDSRSGAWYLSEAVEPDYLEVWDGHTWVSVFDANTGQMAEHVQAEAKFESDEGDGGELDEPEEPNGWYNLNFNTLAPKTASAWRNASIPTVTTQDAKNRGMFGPVYHGTSEDTHTKIQNEGFKVIEGESGSEGISNGYAAIPYANGIPAPVHHLGYGIYFTTVKAIAKKFNGGSVKALKSFYLDVHNVATINFGSVGTMMKWWIANGFDPALAKTDRVAATKQLTDSLKGKHDAVWFKGKGFKTLLDGDQIVVFDPSKVFLLEDSQAEAGAIGSKVQRKSDGMVGVIRGQRPLMPNMYEKIMAAKETATPEQLAGHWFDITPESKYYLEIKWQKGGMDSNVFDTDVIPYVKATKKSALFQHQAIPSASEAPHDQSRRSSQGSEANGSTRRAEDTLSGRVCRLDTIPPSWLQRNSRRTGSNPQGFGREVSIGKLRDLLSLYKQKGFTHFAYNAPDVIVARQGQGGWEVLRVQFSRMAPEGPVWRLIGRATVESNPPPNLQPIVGYLGIKATLFQRKKAIISSEATHDRSQRGSSQGSETNRSSTPRCSYMQHHGGISSTLRGTSSRDHVLSRAGRCYLASSHQPFSISGTLKELLEGAKGLGYSHQPDHPGHLKAIICMWRG